MPGSAPSSVGHDATDSAGSDPQADFFARVERPVAAVVVATSKPEKDWAPERWAAVCDALWHD